jgi:flavin-dependent dehydrogenase
VQQHAYWIHGLRLVTPGDREIFLSGGQDASAIICCRRTFDHILLRQALSLGTDFIPNFDVRTISYDDGRAIGFTSHDGKSVRARFTIIANGAHSTFAVSNRPKRLMQAIMGWWEGVPFTPHHVEMIFDRMVSPCYGWLFPETESRVNIGICYEDDRHTKNARTLFHQFLHKHYRKRLSQGVQDGDWKGHPISYSFHVDSLQAPGRLIIGEAGRMTHPATAEGIYQGMHSGMLAAEAIRDVLFSALGEAVSWANYENRCRLAFARSFRGAKLWRRAITSPLLDGLVRVSQRPMVKTALGKLMAQM